MTKFKEVHGMRLIKFIVFCSLFCLIASIGAISSFAEGGPKIKVVSAMAEKDSSVAVAVDLEGNPGIWGLKLRISYDDSVLTLKSVDAGTVFTADELIMSESLGKKPYVIVASSNQLKNKTENGTVVTLNFEVSREAEYSAYSVEVEVAQANNIDSEDVAVESENGRVTVIECVHSEKEWITTETAGCETQGEEVLTCKKCKDTFETRAINATGHVNTEIRDALEATSAKDGYTGDTYCKDCGKLIKRGEAIEKLPGETTAVGTDAPVTTEDESDDPPVTDKEPSDDKNDNEDDKKKEGTPVAIAVILVLSVIAAVGTGVYFFVKRRFF